MVIVCASVTFGAIRQKQSSGSKPESSHRKKDFCDWKNPSKFVEKLDDCLVEPEIKDPWNECQTKVLGSDEPEEVTKVYCAKSQKEKRQVGKQVCY